MTFICLQSAKTLDGVESPADYHHEVRVDFAGDFFHVQYSELHFRIIDAHFWPLMALFLPTVNVMHDATNDIGFRDNNEHDMVVGGKLRFGTALLGATNSACGRPR